MTSSLQVTQEPRIVETLPWRSITFVGRRVRLDRPWPFDNDTEVPLTGWFVADVDGDMLLAIADDSDGPSDDLETQLLNFCRSPARKQNNDGQ